MDARLIDSLKNLDVTGGMDTEKLVGVRAGLKLFAQNYEDLTLTAPEWVSDKIELVETEIKNRVKTERETALRKLRARKASLMSRDEKRAEIDKQIAELEEAMK